MLFEIDRGAHLYFRKWLSSGELPGYPSANIIIVHGYAEHSGRYEYAGKYLSQKGFSVYAFDLPGHGKSVGSRALIPGIDDLVLKLKLFVEFVKTRDKGEKTFIIGHSMGGVVAALYASLYGNEIDGLITSGAAVMPLPELKGMIQKIAEAVSTLLPELRTLSLDPDKLSRDAGVVEDYRSDPLNYNGKVKLKTAVELSRSRKMIEKAAGNITVPFFVMHGADDTLAEPEGSRLLFEKASSVDKTIRLFDGLRHEILNEPEKELVLEAIRDWLYLRLS
ncbi:MAG: alpha/beta hydrolase [Spirochaetia bacterium]|nr:alpha/beta hydrolase [Spirochaetia bacterium]